MGDIRMVRDGLNVVRYILPRRNLGKMRRLGWVPIAFGLFVTVFMFFWMWGPIASGLRSTGVGRWLGIGFGLLGLPGVAAGFGFLGAGLAILGNGTHSEVSVGNGRICAIERMGVIPLRRCRKTEQVLRLIVEKGGIPVTDNRGRQQTIARDLAFLKAEMQGGAPFLLVPGYPAELLRSLADKLASALPAGNPSSVLETDAPAVEVVESEAGKAVEDVEVPMPAGTDITLRRERNGLAISVPPRGLWKGSQGLFFFSLFWNGFMVVFTLAMLQGKAPLPACLFLLLFWAIGLGLLFGSIQMARRRVLLAVVNDVLACRSMGPFGTKERRLQLAEIETIRVGPSGVEVNHRPVMELQFISRSGQKTGILSNRSREEQEWLAWVLRQYLPVRHPSGTTG